MDRRIFLQRITAGALLLAGCGRQSPAGPPVKDPPVEDPPRRKRLLVLTQTAEFRHDSIAAAVEAVRSLGRESGKWEVVMQADTAAQVEGAIATEGLRQIDGVVFANTTGALSFTPQGRAAFYEWMRAGGSYIGIHSASDTFHNDPEYRALLGGEFLTHGPQTEVSLVVQDPAHPACRDLPATFPFLDEIYEFQHWSRDAVHVLLAMHHHPQTGAPGDFPIAWTSRHAKGRVFYTALGHRDDVYASLLFRSHLAGGILWALGLEPGDDTPGNPIR